jgi:Icc-related predicted phosphoesterase
MAEKQPVVRVAAVADLHIGKTARSVVHQVIVEAAAQADVLLLGGDLTDSGLSTEAEVLAREVSSVRLPCIAVLGNHDFEAGQQTAITQVLRTAGIMVLDGETCEVHGIGFAGVKGFVGGFDRHVLSPWGESSIKNLVHEAVEETLKLESALAKLRTPQRVALLHYAPIRATVEGEPVEIFPFLGCSRLEEPLNRYAVTAVFHGHAHRGTFTGRTHNGIPVYNVALPLLRQQMPEGPPFHLLEIAVGVEQHAASERAGTA